MNYTFGAPQWFWGFLLIPLFALLFWWANRRSRQALARFIPERLQPMLVETVNFPMRIARQVVILLAIACLLLALAKPRAGYIMRDVLESGRDILVAVDVSKSMLARDISPTRLLRAKLAVQDLMDAMPGDRFGLIAFAGSAFLQAPLTRDHSAVSNAVQALSPGVIPRGGSNIASAIQVAIEAFGKAEGNDRALVIFTDGEELDDDAVAAAEEAEEKGIRIFTIGVGSPEGSEIRVPQPGGGYEYVRDRSGNPVRSQLDENRLKEIASTANGRYFRLDPGMINQLVARGLKPLNETRGESSEERIPLERYQWPLGAALILLFLWYVMSERRRKSRPNTVVSSLLLSLGLFGFGQMAPAQNPSDEGVDLYAKGEYGKALEAFNAQRDIDPDRAEWSFNAGSAAYKAGEYDRAISEFGAALASDDENLQQASYYNLGNTLFQKGQAAESNDKKIEFWEEAIEQYSDALKINPANQNAEYNRDLVEQLLAQLKEEEQEQQEQEDQDQEQQENQEQQEEDGEKQDSDDQQGDQNEQNQEQQGDQSQQQKEQQEESDSEQDQEGQSQDQGKNQEEDQEGSESGDQQEQEQSQEEQQEEQDSGGGQDQEESQEQPQSGEGEDDQQQEGREQPGDSDQQQDASEDGEQSPDSPPNDQAQQDGEPPPIPEDVDQGEGERPEGDLQANQQGGQPQEAQVGPETEVERGGQLSEAEARALLNALKGEDDTVNLYDKRRMRTPVTRDW